MVDGPVNNPLSPAMGRRADINGRVLIVDADAAESGLLTEALGEGGAIVDAPPPEGPGSGSEDHPPAGDIIVYVQRPVYAAGSAHADFISDVAVNDHVIFCGELLSIWISPTTWIRLDCQRSNASPETGETPWLDATAKIVDGFAQRVVEQWDVLYAVALDDAAEIGRAAAESALAAARWSRVVGDRLDTATVTRLLGVTRQALSKRQVAGSLLGLPGQRTTWYPAWQFDVEARVVRPEVRDIIGAFRDALGDVDPLLIASWAVTPQDEDLDGFTPQEWMRLGRDRERLRLAAERAASRLAQ